MFKSKNKQKFLTGNESSVLMLLLYIIMTAAVLILVLIGCNIYKNLIESKTDNEKLRSSLAYLVTRLETADSNGRIAIKDNEITISEAEGYETRIYCNGSELIEQISKAEESSGEKVNICKANSLYIEKISSSLVKIEIDDKSTFLMLHGGIDE